RRLFERDLLFAAQAVDPRPAVAAHCAPAGAEARAEQRGGAEAHAANGGVHREPGRTACGSGRAGADAEAAQGFRIEGVELPAAVLQWQLGWPIGVEFEAEQAEQGIDAALLGVADRAAQLLVELFAVGIQRAMAAR